MKLKAQVEGLAVTATVETADLAQDTLMEITGDATVDKAPADGIPIGRLTVPAKEADGTGTVETRFKELVEMEADGILAAGAKVQLGTLSPTDGKHTAKAWVEGTDTLLQLYGVVWVGGADEATIQVLTF